MMYYRRWENEPANNVVLRYLNWYNNGHTYVTVTSLQVKTELLKLSKCALVG